MYMTVCKIDSQWEAAIGAAVGQLPGELSLGLCDNVEGRDGGCEGGSRGKGCM